MKTSSFKTLLRPAAALACASSLLMTACGGGGGDSGVPVPVPVPPVQMTITHTVKLTTSKGVIELGLDANHAPITVANFLKYSADGYYSGTLFHRVIKDFVIQGGGMVRAANGSLADKPASYAPIALESHNGLSNVRGTIAMARTSQPNSATSQFFINTVDNSNCLDYGRTACDASGKGYAVFGKVTAGMDVVDQIRAVTTRSEGQFTDVPLQDVVITEAKKL